MSDWSRHVTLSCGVCLFCALFFVQLLPLEEDLHRCRREQQEALQRGRQLEQKVEELEERNASTAGERERQVKLMEVNASGTLTRETCGAESCPPLIQYWSFTANQCPFKSWIKKNIVEIDAEAEIYLYGSNSLTVCEIWMGFQIALALKLHSF